MEAAGQDEARRRQEEERAFQRSREPGRGQGQGQRQDHVQGRAEGPQARARLAQAEHAARGQRAHGHQGEAGRGRPIEVRRGDEGQHGRHQEKGADPGPEPFALRRLPAAGPSGRRRSRPASARR